MEIAILFLVIAVLFIIKTVKVVPQQHAWVVERLGKYHASLTPGLNFVVPFVDNVIQKHSLKEIPWTCPVRSASRATTRSCRSMAFCTFR